MFDVRQYFRKWFLFALSILQTEYYLTRVPLVSHICIGELGQHLVQVKACRLFGAKTLLDLFSIAPLGTHFSEILIGIQSFSLKNMRLKISQRNFLLGDLYIYSTPRPISYVWYVMRAKCWWPYLGHRTNSLCNRVWHNTLPPYAASHWLCYLFIAIPTSQGMPTKMIEISHLLLIASTECTQYRFCRWIHPSAVGALVSIRRQANTIAIGTALIRAVAISTLSH